MGVISGIPSVKNPGAVLVIPATSAVWTAATVASVGPPTFLNTQDFGWRQTIVSSGAQSGMIRQYAGLSGSANWLPGTLPVINWSVGFRLAFTLQIDIGGTEAKWTLHIGGLSAATGAHALAAKGLGICITGTAADNAGIQVRAHDGTTEGLSSSVALGAGVFDGTSNLWELVWIPGSGAYLYRNGVAVTAVTTNLPAGSGGSSANGWEMLFEHTTNTNATSILVLHNLIVSPL